MPWHNGGQDGLVLGAREWDPRCSTVGSCIGTLGTVPFCQGVLSLSALGDVLSTGIVSWMGAS